MYAEGIGTASIALSQNGIFTAKQAKEAGFDARNHHYHVKSGHWEKEHRGIYRLAHLPFEPFTQYALWPMWSCNRKGEVQGDYLGVCIPITSWLDTG